MHRSHNRKYFVIILAIALALRLGFLFLVHPWTYPVEQQLAFNDSPLYHQLACTLLDHHRFAASAIAEPDPLRTPMYPLFVAAIYALFGEVPWVVFVAQILIDCLSCYLIFLTLRRTLNETVAHIGAFFYAIDPFLILYTSSFLTEILFVFFLAVSLYIYGIIAAQKEDRNSVLRYGLLGLALGAATLVRPAALHTVVILTLFLLVVYRKRLVVFLKYCAALVIAFVFVLSPWLIRNYRTFGSPAVTYCDSWILLAGYVGSMEAAKRGQDLDPTSAQLMAQADSLIAADGLRPEDLGPMEKANYWKRLALRYIRRDPIHFAIAQLKGTIFIFANLGTSNFMKVLHLPPHPLGKPGTPRNFLQTIGEFLAKKSPTEMLVGALVAPLLAITYLALAVGLFVAWRRFDKVFLAFCLLMTLYFVIVPGALGTVRFKLPALPFFVSFVGIGIAHVAERWNAHRGTAADSSQRC
jgi:4-amino-4-deoxy-L-arabinose transferase-like glycosyltransferase